MACGCIVFSSLNHALADILTPGEIGHQIGCGSLSNDVDRITSALLDPDAWKPSGSKLDLVLEDLSEELQVKRWEYVLSRLDKLLPFLNKTSLIKQRSRYHIIMSKLLRKLLIYIKKILRLCSSTI